MFALGFPSPRGPFVFLQHAPAQTTFLVCSFQIKTDTGRHGQCAQAPAGSRRLPWAPLPVLTPVVLDLLQDPADGSKTATIDSCKPLSMQAASMQACRTRTQS